MYGKINQSINQPSQDNRPRTTVPGQPSQDNRPRTTVPGQPSQDSPPRQSSGQDDPWYSCTRASGTLMALRASVL